MLSKLYCLYSMLIKIFPQFHNRAVARENFPRKFFFLLLLKSNFVDFPFCPVRPAFRGHTAGFSIKLNREKKDKRSMYIVLLDRNANIIYDDDDDDFGIFPHGFKITFQRYCHLAMIIAIICCLSARLFTSNSALSFSLSLFITLFF